AHRLRERGVGAESLVGLCLERTPELLVGVLAILKAGGAYVPLDPSYPQDRRFYMVADAGVNLVLTQESLCSIWPPSADLHLLCLDQENYAGLPLTNPAQKTDPANAAYLIYTSGSTGRPNGVLVPQRALVNHCTAIAQTYGLQASDRVLQFASLNFDVAAEEIFPAWLVGAAVVMRSDRTSMAHDDFFQQAEQEQLSVINLPTPYWQELVGQLARAGTQVLPPSSLRILVIGSDKASPEYVALWQQLMGQRIRLYNAYGPTEATITAAVYALDHTYHQEQMHSVPIGRPIANVQFHILDGHLLPVPQGIPGELYIGGEGLARGYVRNAALTAERFIPHPFNNLPGQRLYKTGDIARYLPDGNLEYMGRVDYQVKIRGFRVEPGEIEKTLMQHPDIEECLVQVYEEAPDDRRLAAYLVSHREPLLTNGEIRGFLKERLPSYMLPSTFILLETL
ncbi:MAG TPA: amino acid adenylation domain-containing protein, partial [Ktedonobacteraceae bacterium]|nr:amino acid adenylation domain-containing protein [Ktedonobacteraceae bacterium]